MAAVIIPAVNTGSDTGTNETALGEKGHKIYSPCSEQRCIIKLPKLL